MDNLSIGQDHEDELSYGQDLEDELSDLENLRLSTAGTVDVLVRPFTIFLCKRPRQPREFEVLHLPNDIVHHQYQHFYQHSFHEPLRLRRFSPASRRSWPYWNHAWLVELKT